MTYRYHPELQELVDDPAGFPPAEKFVGTLEEMRAFADPLYAEMRDLPLAEGVVARDVEIETADGYPMRARWYRKEGSDARSAVMYVHGGGMILMGIDEMDADISRYVALSGVPFLSIGYRLAPEHPRPQAEDALDGYLWLIGHADELGIDAHRVAIMGDSGGAGIAAGAAILARDRGVPLAKQILIYPMLDDRTVALHTCGSRRTTRWPGRPCWASAGEPMKCCPARPRRATRASRAWRRLSWRWASSTCSATKPSSTRSA